MFMVHDCTAYSCTINTEQCTRRSSDLNCTCMLSQHIHFLFIITRDQITIRAALHTPVQSMKECRVHCHTRATYTCTCAFSFDSQWKLQVLHDFTFGATPHKIVVKRTAIEKRLRFFFTMFSTSDITRR